MEKPHLFVATPCYGGLVTHHYASSLLKLQAACLASGVELTARLLGGDALITRARNILVEQFLETPGATHILFIDADIGFQPDQVFRLIQAGKDIAGAAYPLKGEIGGKLSYVVGFTEPGAIRPVDGFARANYLGNGFMLVKRDVFARLAAHYPAIAFRQIHAAQNFQGQGGIRHAYFDCMIDPATGHYLSEDFTFCKRWTEMGGEIWVDLDSKLVHVGPTEFRGDLTASLGASGA